MRFWIWSDLHDEIGGSVMLPERPANVDAILIAGDLGHANQIARIAKFYIDYYDLPIIYVAGNHEFYRQETMEKAVADIEFAAYLSVHEGWKQRFHFLNRDVLVLGDTRIVGATLWVDMAMGAINQDDRIWRLQEARFALNDFRFIKIAKDKIFRPADMLQLYRKDAAYIREQLMQPFDGKTVVLTHHMPHPDCTPEVYRGDKHNYLFASSEQPFGELFESENAPDLWVCGHTHNAFDIVIGRTRVICNPHGYDNEYGRNGFRWDLVIDIDELIPQPTRRHP
ncbi:metallophosphoesterase family protein [Brucella ciceri]|uniref:metallophosphoesterase n=1 Tax=Brucella ciceri TaxID=391287 RepID=UPI000DE1DFEA|nr:metallophosphoesterase [Brucella ciceri]MCH6206375.1 metallophosphoesterase family protein [Brucella ciceri]